MNQKIKLTTTDGEIIQVLISGTTGREALEKYQRLVNEPIKELAISTLPEAKLLAEHAFQVLFNEGDEFTSFCETHYLVVEAILAMRGQPAEAQPVEFLEYYENGGTGMLMEAARKIALKFEEQHKDVIWDGEYWDTVEEFVADVNWEDI